MTDDQLRRHFGLTERALSRLQATSKFPKKDPLVNKTDRKAVDIFFDVRSGIASPIARGGLAAPDGEENFDGI